MSQRLKSLILAGILTFGGCASIPEKQVNEDINLAKRYSKQGIIAYFHGTNNPDNLIKDSERAIKILDLENPEHKEYLKGAYMGLITGYGMKGQEEKSEQVWEKFMYLVKKDKS
jgi:hypothetical protein